MSHDAMRTDGAHVIIGLWTWEQDSTFIYHIMLRSVMKDNLHIRSRLDEGPCSVNSPLSATFVQGSHRDARMLID